MLTLKFKIKVNFAADIFTYIFYQIGNVEFIYDNKDQTSVFPKDKECTITPYARYVCRSDHREDF